MLALLQPSVAFPDILVSISENGNDTIVQAVGSLDVTGAGVGGGGFVSHASLDIFSSETATTLSTTISSGSNFGNLQYLWDVEAFRSFGNVTPRERDEFFQSDPNGFILSISDNNFNTSPLPFDTVVVPNPSFISLTGGNVTHTIADVSLLSSWGVAVGDFWGVEIPVLNAAGEETDATQTLTFQVVQSVPEPSSLYLGTLLAAFALGKRRRR